MTWRAVRRAILTAVVIATTSGAAAEPPSFNGNRKPAAIVLPAMPAPVTPLYTDHGGVTNIARHKGSVILLNIWATWCTACLHELPDLDRLQAAYPDGRLKVLTVSVDEAGHDAIMPYFRRLGIKHLPALADPAGRSVDAFGVYDGLPWSIIIDPAGRFRAYLMGAAGWNTAEARAFLEYYLEK